VNANTGNTTPRRRAPSPLPHGRGSCSSSCFVPRARAPARAPCFAAPRLRVSPAVGRAPCTEQGPAPADSRPRLAIGPKPADLLFHRTQKITPVKIHPASRERKHREHNTSQAGPISAPSRSRLLLVLVLRASCLALVLVLVLRARARASCSCSCSKGNRIFDYEHEHHFIEHEHVSARREKRESLRNRTNSIPNPPAPGLPNVAIHPCQSVPIRGPKTSVAPPHFSSRLRVFA
jgi:hypothetical protein